MPKVRVKNIMLYKNDSKNETQNAELPRVSKQWCDAVNDILRSITQSGTNTESS